MEDYGDACAHLTNIIVHNWHFLRLHALTSANADGLCVVHKYNQLMKNLPLNKLLSATNLDKIQESLLIFGLSPYPICHALPLVEPISHDFNDQLLRVLTCPVRSIWQTPHTDIFRTWDDLIKGSRVWM